MIGSRLLGQQPTFRGVDFAMPEVSLFGYYEFRSAVATSDSWEQHDGVEILLMRSGEACWETTDDDHYTVVTGGQAVMFPAGTRHRVANGVYSPCRLFWMVFDAKDIASANARLFPSREIEALFDLATCQVGPIVLTDTCIQDLSDLCSQLTDERLLIGSALIMADVRSRIYSSIIEMWKTGGSGGDHAHSALVRQAVKLLRASADGSAADDHDEKIADIASQLGYGKSRLYDLFGREVGMAPNDYRQRVRIKRCCQRLVQTDESVTSIGISSGFGSSQYFARVFKKYVGVTPTAYRQLFGRGPVPAVARELR